jgi:hypothetical protein
MAAEDLLTFATSEKAKNHVLRQALRVWVDGLPDEDARLKALNMTDPHIKGGTVAAGTPATTTDALADL